MHEVSLVRQSKPTPGHYDFILTDLSFRRFITNGLGQGPFSTFSHFSLVVLLSVQYCQRTTCRGEVEIAVNHTRARTRRATIGPIWAQVLRMAAHSAIATRMDPTITRMQTDLPIRTRLQMAGFIPRRRAIRGWVEAKSNWESFHPDRLP